MSGKRNEDRRAEREATLRSAYRSFNRRDLEAVVGLLHSDAEWPDLLAGRTLRGHEAVLNYWHSQFESIESLVEPREIAQDGQLAAVFVDQSVRELATGAEREARVVHVWTFDGDLATRMEAFSEREHPNLELFRRFHQAQVRFYAGDSAGAVAELLSEQVEWHVPGRNAIAGTYCGRDEVLSYFEKRRDLAARTFTIDVRDELAADAGVVTLAYGAARLRESDAQWGTAGIYRMSGRRVCGGWLLPLEQAAFDEIWS